jgi:lipopolysaccharide export system protein LptA
VTANRLGRGAGHGTGSALLGLLAVALLVRPAMAQQIDLSHGGPIVITAAEGIEWHQAQQEVIAVGDAKAVRDNVTVTADRLIAWYRKKAGAAADAAQPGTAQPNTAQPAQGGVTGDEDTGGNEVYRLQAIGHVHIYTQTDQVWGDVATYDLDQAVLVITGHDLKLTTPTQMLTARDDMEYWAQRHMAVARGDAVAVTNDGRRLQADTLVAYTSAAPAQGAAQGTASGTPVATQVSARPGGPQAAQDPLTSSGKLEKVEAFGHVVVRTVTDTATGDRGVYVPDTGIARVIGKVRITRGQNQLDGSEAEVNMKTGVSRLLAGNYGRVQGLMLPNDQAASQGAAKPTPPSPGAGKRP